MSKLCLQYVFILVFIKLFLIIFMDKITYNTYLSRWACMVYQIIKNRHIKQNIIIIHSYEFVIVSNVNVVNTFSTNYTLIFVRFYLSLYSVVSPNLLS